jgi:hypothetical protein
VICIGRFIGPQVSEYAQTSPLKIDYHVYPSGKKVIKAFTANDFAFYNNLGNLIIPLGNKSADIVKKVKITWQIQKNVEMVRRLHCQPMTTTPKSVLSAQRCEW